MTARATTRVLISSDDPVLADALSSLLSAQGAVVQLGALPSVLDALRRADSPRLLILVETGTDSHALDVLRTVKAEWPNLAVLLVSTMPSVEHAAESIRRGAEDYVSVPYSEEIVRKQVTRILDAAELRDRVNSLDRLVATRYGFERIISRSRVMRAVFDRAVAAARSETPVLIVGET